MPTTQFERAASANEVNIDGRNDLNMKPNFEAYDPENHITNPNDFYEDWSDDSSEPEFQNTKSSFNLSFDKNSLNRQNFDGIHENLIGESNPRASQNDDRPDANNSVENVEQEETPKLTNTKVYTYVKNVLKTMTKIDDCLNHIFNRSWKLPFGVNSIIIQSILPVTYENRSQLCMWYATLP